MTPYLQNGQRYAVGAGEFIQFDAHSEGSGFDGALTVCSGLSTRTLKVDRVLPAQNMNIFAVPQDVAKPEGISGVALDAMGDIYYCLSMA